MFGLRVHHYRGNRRDVGAQRALALLRKLLQRVARLAGEREMTDSAYCMLLVVAVVLGYIIGRVFSDEDRRR